MPKTLDGVWVAEGSPQDWVLRAHVGRFRAYIHVSKLSYQTVGWRDSTHCGPIVVRKDENKKQEREAIIRQGKEQCEADFQEYRKEVRQEAEALGFRVSEDDDGEEPGSRSPSA